MDLKFPSAYSLICQYFRKGYCQAVSEKPLACFTLDIKTLNKNERKANVRMTFTDTEEFIWEQKWKLKSNIRS